MTVVLSTAAVPRGRAFTLVKLLVLTAVAGSVFLVGTVSNAQPPAKVEFTATVPLGWWHGTQTFSWFDLDRTQLMPPNGPYYYLGSTTNSNGYTCQATMQIDWTSNPAKLSWGTSTIVYDGSTIGTIAWDSMDPWTDPLWATGWGGEVSARPSGTLRPNQ